MKKIIVGLDIGTANTKILGVTKKGKDFEIVFQAKERSEGVRKGVIFSPEQVTEILREIFSRIKKETGQKPDSVFVNINGAHLFSLSSRGVVAVSRADQKISEEDTQRVLQAAQNLPLSLNKEILNAIPKEFIVDGEGGIKDPVGLQGIKLEAEVLILGGFSPYIKNLEKAVLNSDLQIEDIIPSPLASAKSCLIQRQKELGVILIDIGAATTGLAIFDDGDLIHLTILPIGSTNITNKIAINLKTDVEIAERIKIEYGTCLFRGKDKRERIDIGEEEPLIFSHRSLSKVIERGISEIFSVVKKELKKFSERNFPAGIVLTGGGSKIPKILSLAKKEFKLPVKLGRPRGISGIDDPSFSVVSGLVLEGAEFEKIPEFGEGMISRIKRFFRIFLP
jgi:cell division protein FtsA